MKKFIENFKPDISTETKIVYLWKIFKNTCSVGCLAGEKFKMFVTGMGIDAQRVKDYIKTVVMSSRDPILQVTNKK